MGTPSTRDAEPYTLPIHEPTGRPLWHGLPVPWVARWTGEQPPPRAPIPTLLNGRLWYSYDDPRRHLLGVRIGIMAQRDSFGLLWKREGNVYGVGDEDATIQDYTTAGAPEWAKVHALRQRTCMLDRRCQVCSKPFGDGPTTFLVTPDDSRGEQIIDPPVCESCIPIAVRLCPHQKAHPPLLIRAVSYRPSFVYAQTPTPGGWVSNRIPLNDDILSLALAMQIGVTVIDYTVQPA